MQRKSSHISLQTRDARLVKGHAGLLNLRVVSPKKLPVLNEDNIRKLLRIDMERGIFEADTPEAQEAIGQIRQSQND